MATFVKLAGGEYAEIIGDTAYPISVKSLRRIAADNATIRAEYVATGHHGVAAACTRRIAEVLATLGADAPFGAPTRRAA